MTLRHYTVAGVAGLLSVSAKTVRRWIQAGDLEALALGPAQVRISELEVRRFLAERQGSAARVNYWVAAEQPDEPGGTVLARSVGELRRKVS